MMKQVCLKGKPSGLFLILVVLGLLIVQQAKAAESYNLTTDFSAANNPNPPWTYGHYDSLNEDTFAAFLLPAAGGQYELPADLNTLPGCENTGGYLEGWRDYVDPNILKNTGSTTYCGGYGGITFNEGAVTFGPHPPADGFPVARFTVPSAGKWQVVATFTGVQIVNTPASAWIHNGSDFVTVDDAVHNGETSTYNQILTLAANATIDIVVGGGSKTTEVTATITKQSVNVGIDIKPGSEPNSINLCSYGAVPIAILGSGTFDVDDIDTETLKFADAGVKVVGKKDRSLCSYEDVNEDGFVDLVCHFVTMDIAGIDGESTLATVNGALLDETEIEGTDSVNIVKDTCD